MPIKTLQQQQAQVGRIRIGQQVPTKGGKTRPDKLDRFRFTTPSQQLAEAVAARYGGAVAPWQPDGRPAEFEIISEARALPVLVPPRPVTQWYEMWSGAGCQRRCDGETETLSGDPCKCPVDAMARADEAAKGRACKATTRLKVMLPELPGIGVWRIDSHGYYAAIELPQTAEFLGAVTEANGYIRATLELQKRQVRRPGVGVREFMVPALHVSESPDALMAGAGRVAVTGGPQAVGAIGAAPVAIEAATGSPARLAQELADQVMNAASREELAEIWKAAAAAHLTGQEEVSDENGVITPLLDFIQRRGQVFAQAVQPDGDVDALWSQVMAAVPEAWSMDEVEAEFFRVTEVPVASAAAEHMQAFLTHLASVAA